METCIPILVLLETDVLFPQLVLHQGSPVSYNDQRILGSSEGHVQPALVVEETDLASLVRSHAGDDDDVPLLALERVHRRDFDILPLLCGHFLDDLLLHLLCLGCVGTDHADAEFLVEPYELENQVGNHLGFATVEVGLALSFLLAVVDIDEQGGVSLKLLAHFPKGPRFGVSPSVDDPPTVNPLVRKMGDFGHHSVLRVEEVRFHFAVHEALE